jgi:hypothetical protein
VLVLAVGHVIAQSTSTVLTGNHYFLDWAGGVTVAVAGIAFAGLMQRRGYELVRRLLGIGRDGGDDQRFESRETVR